MSFIFSFEPVCTPSATALILGSMPGKASLTAGQYYAHPRNLFWPIMGHLFEAGPELAYEARLQKLTEAGIALWDVLKSCLRESSLDSDIDESSIATNDFESFFAEHPYIQHVFFNGAKAEASFQKYVYPGLSPRAITYHRLPSTSPANASIPYERKIAAWKNITQSSSA